MIVFLGEKTSYHKRAICCMAFLEFIISDFKMEI